MEQASTVSRIEDTSALEFAPCLSLSVTFAPANCEPIDVFEVAAPGPVSREKVLALEEALKLLPPAEAPVTHHFAPGVYMREMLIPKHTILTGKIHRHAHMSILLRGDLSVLTEHGMRRLQGPCVLESAPGIKRAGFAHEDSVWITIHPNPDDEQDLDTLEARHIAPSFEALEVKL